MSKREPMRDSMRRAVKDKNLQAVHTGQPVGTDSKNDDRAYKQESVYTHSTIPSHIRQQLEKREYPQYCVVTRESKESVIEIAYILRRSTHVERLEVLRRAWRSKTRPVVDTVENLIYLRADLHKDFDLGFWALFPDMSLLKDIVATTVLSDSTDLYKEYLDRRFNYRLAWIRTSLCAPRVRGLDSSLSDDHEEHQHPSTDFPILRSHVHPLLVIDNAGQKICELPWNALDKLGPEASVIDHIYRGWHRMDPRTDRPTESDHQDDGDNDEASGAPSQVEHHDLTASWESESSEALVRCSMPGNAETRPYSTFNAMSVGSSADAASPTHDGMGSSNQDSDSVLHECLEDDVQYHESLTEWAATCMMDPTVELTNDHQLPQDDEVARPPSPQEWKRWAQSPPKMPEVILDHHDTSKLTSYEWSLYHHRVNLLAPYGAHEVPESHFTPWVPGVYDL